MPRISLLLFYIISTAGFHTKAQNSGFFLRNYNNSEYRIGNENWSIREANTGIMYFANSKGVYSYDGVRWKLIKTPQAALSLAVDKKTEKIYVGCRYGFGYISRAENGTEEYHSLSKDIQEADDVTDIFINGNEVVFFDNKNIYTADISTDKLIQIIHGSEKRRFTGLIRHQNQIYANVLGEGLQIISGQRFMNMQPDPQMQNARLVFGIPFSLGTSLIGTEDNQLFIFDGAKTTKFNVEAQPYIDDNLLASATDVSGTQICIATMAGGCLLINKQTGKTESMINYRTGLPDDEILAVEKDNEGGLWMAHSQGITRADLRVGFKTYSNFPGLEGYLISSLNFSDRLYVSTSEGVFYLDKVRTLQEAKTVIDHNRKQEIEKEIKHDEAPSKRRFFGNLFRKKERQQPLPGENQAKEKSNKGQRNMLTAQDIVLKPKYNTDFVFKKIKIINGKCRQLMSAGDRIIVASNTGLYEIASPDQVRLIVKNEDINTAYLSSDGSKIYAGSNKSLFCVIRQNNFWECVNTVNLKWGAYSLYEDKDKNLWIGGMGKALKLEFNSKGRPVQFKDYFLKNVYNEHVLVSPIHNRIYFLVSSGAYFYNPSLDALETDAELTKNYAGGNFIPSNGKNTWAKTAGSWASLDPSSADKDMTLPLLALFKDIQNITTDANGNLWLIVGDDEIYNIDKRDYNIKASRFDLHLREITNDQGMHLTLKNLELDHTSNSVNFYFAAPHYLDETSVEYQYMLKGAGEKWSAWINNPHFKFPFLPSGNYELMVRARNSLGQISKVEVFSFRIHPPYWKTMWFYLAEICFFSLLIMLSITMNRNKNNLFLSKALTFLTLIIIIEFIHQYISGIINVSASDNPLMRLGLDVLMALLISPIEKLLELIIMKRKRQMAQMVIYSKKQIKASKDWIGRIAKT